MDAFYQKGFFDSYDCLIVGITIIIKKPDGESLHFLNVYNAIEPVKEFEIDKLAQVCQHLPLGFIPYQLRHTRIHINGRSEKVFLLAGGDQQIHVFRSNDKQNFEEVSCGKFFPEFVNLPGVVLWMDIKNFANKRLSAVGCDNGQLLVCSTNTEENRVMESWTLSLDGPISTVRFFSLSKNKRKEKISSTSGSDISESEDEKLHLLVTSCLEVSVVFVDILNKGLDDMSVLNQSDQFDSVTCSCVADIDFDGNNEIILGTYGQELLVYKWSAADNGLSDHIRFDLMWSRSFSKPLLSIRDLDLMNDGMQELVIVSLTGVHILQQNVSMAAETLLDILIKAFPDQKSITTFNEKFNNRHIPEHDKDKSDHEELEGLIEAMCSTDNSYNEVT